MVKPPQKDEDIISLEDDPDLASLIDDQVLSSSLDLNPRWDCYTVELEVMCEILIYIYLTFKREGEREGGGWGRGDSNQEQRWPLLHYK